MLSASPKERFMIVRLIDIRPGLQSSTEKWRIPEGSEDGCSALPRRSAQMGPRDPIDWLRHTMLPDSKRRLLYNKRVAPNTFMFFFHTGPSETSWSVRDYSVPGSVGLRYSSDFQDGAGRIPLASEIRAAAEYDFPAPAHPTTDLNHWHAAIRAKNAEYLAGESPATPSPVLIPQTQPSDGTLTPSFPILNLPKLVASPKARKRGDIERILHSENSEDYVTWNFFQLLESVPASCGGRRS